MKRSVWPIPVACVVLAAILAAMNCMSAEPRQDIVRFLQITGMFDGIRSGAEYYVTELKQKHPKAPATFWETVSAQEVNQYTESLKGLYIKTYGDYFTAEEMSSILEFLETDHGKKFRRLNEVLLPTLMKAVTKETKTLEDSVNERLSAKGY